MAALNFNHFNIWPFQGHITLYLDLCCVLVLLHVFQSRAASAGGGAVLAVTVILFTVQWLRLLTLSRTFPSPPFPWFYFIFFHFLLLWAFFLFFSVWIIIIICAFPLFPLIISMVFFLLKDHFSKHNFLFLICLKGLMHQIQNIKIYFNGWNKSKCPFDRYVLTTYNTIISII